MKGRRRIGLTSAPNSRLMNWMDGSDGTAVERARAGDPEAFRSLVERHSRSVFRLAFRMTGNEEDAEDVVQETFLRAYRQLPQFESRANFGTWLYRIATNCSFDLLRSRARHEEHRGARREGELDGIDAVASAD